MEPKPQISRRERLIERMMQAFIILMLLAIFLKVLVI